ncbi:nitroreductase/quinone reductase family protein [Mycolicibacterium litorale]|uniref:nitroreductase/quinone reductase family protein n=1 Tax=Mycolicibacterium litorale TaxID=758802 RepID=UPI003CE93465
MVYFDIDGRILIAGSFGGAPKAPAWVHNLRATPRVHKTERVIPLFELTRA